MSIVFELALASLAILFAEFLSAYVQKCSAHGFLYIVWPFTGNLRFCFVCFPPFCVCRTGKVSRAAAPAAD